MKRILILTLVFAVGLFVGLQFEQGGVTVKTEGGEWIQVHYPDGSLSEWQQSDGAVYRFLERLLEDELIEVAPQSAIKGAVT